ncbi:MAG: hypothetical protein CR974_02340 [Gammaproteobacteria bacterium]|nr:MAG: hypothetical protein CR974_02340 [Gammaproteobacteria bacterium]
MIQEFQHSAAGAGMSNTPAIDEWLHSQGRLINMTSPQVVQPVQVEPEQPAGEVVEDVASKDAFGMLAEFFGSIGSCIATLIKSLSALFVAVIWLKIFSISAPFVAMFYLVLSIVLFFMYYNYTRERGQQLAQPSESSLHLIALAGGWPGGLIGRFLFAYESRGRMYNPLFMSTIFINICLSYYLIFASFTWLDNVQHGLFKVYQGYLEPQAAAASAPATSGAQPIRPTNAPIVPETPTPPQ